MGEGGWGGGGVGSSADWEEISENRDGQRHCCCDAVVNNICDRHQVRYITRMEK